GMVHASGSTPRLAHGARGPAHTRDIGPALCRQHNGPLSTSGAADDLYGQSTANGAGSGLLVARAGSSRTGRIWNSSHAEACAPGQEAPGTSKDLPARPSDCSQYRAAFRIGAWIQPH